MQKFFCTYLLGNELSSVHHFYSLVRRDVILLLATKSWLILLNKLRCLLIELVGNCTETYGMIATLSCGHHNRSLISRLLLLKRKPILTSSHLLILLLLLFRH